MINPIFFITNKTIYLDTLTSHVQENYLIVTYFEKK